MSKTNKITRLKKRIAELENKLNRREDIGINPTAPTVSLSFPTLIKTELLISTRMYESSCNITALRESLMFELFTNLANDKDFLRTARVESKLDDKDPETIHTRAAILVLPYRGDMWED